MKRIRTILRALDPKAAATMSRRERTEAFRIRRSVVAWILALCVIVSCTSCSVHAVLVNAVLNGHAKTAQIGNSGTRSEKNGSIREVRKEIAAIREENPGIVGNERRKGLSGGNGGTAGRRRHQSASRAVGRADGRSESEILAKAQQTAQNSGYGMVQYHYCVVTNGEVGSVEDFSNAVFRILNSEHGWARRRDFRTFYGRQLRFRYRARPSVDLADVLVGMFGAIQLPCGQQCDYQRRSLEFRHGRVDVGRRRLGAISHDGDQS